MTKIQQVNLAMRALMETGIVLSMAYWGYTVGSTLLVKVLLAILAPLLVFGFWGLVDFHQAGSLAEPLRLVEELLMTLLVALALVAAGQPVLGLLFGLLSVIYHASVYFSGERLLKQTNTSLERSSK